MDEIKQMIADAAKEIIDGVDGISEGTRDYDRLLEQLIRIQTINYNAINPEAKLEVPENPAPLRVTKGIRRAAAQINENNKLKEEKEATQEAIEYLEEVDEEEPTRH